MAHYAFLDENNVVTEVITGKDETDLTHDWEIFYSKFRQQVCKSTSYHGNIRGMFASIGDIYDAELDAFVFSQ